MHLCSASCARPVPCISLSHTTPAYPMEFGTTTIAVSQD